jgi:type II secretory pathway pseudopilin PulG
MRNQKLLGGFTLIETLAAIAISVFLISITFYSFSSLRNNSSLQKDVSQAKSILEEARYSSISEKGDYSYGVHLQSDGLVSFRGSVYNSADAQNNTQLFDDATIDNISLNGGGSEVIFSKITGSTNNFGTFRIKSLKDPNKSTTIRVIETGVISEE